MKLSLSNVMNIIGLSLLGLCFAISLWRVFTRTAKKHDTETTTIRFSHWQLEGGLREAFDVLIQEYEEVKRQQEIDSTKAMLLESPDDEALQSRLARLVSGDLYPVQVIQTPIPERVYAPWSKTRLIGGDAPEIICIGMGITKELTAKYFLPLRDYIDLTNPYNDNTPLEGMAWRDTFLDGLEGENSYDRQLLEHYGIPYTVLTIRAFYNKQLYERILRDPKNASLRQSIGDADFPQTYNDFLALCDAVVAYNQENGTSIIPVAGSAYNAPRLMNMLFRSQTQALYDDYDQWRNLDLAQDDLILSLATHKLKYDNPKFRSGFELMHDVSKYMQHGYQQLQREDATFRFIQEQALVITTGTWDAPSLWLQAGNLFDVGIARIPIPTREHEEYGSFVRGKESEAGTVPYGNLGVVNYKSQDRIELAIDFLMFITSYQGNYTFSQLSGWLPALDKVKPPERLKRFMPEPGGVPKGPRPDFHKTDGEINRVYEQNKHLLADPNAGVDEFYEAIGDEMVTAAQSDVRMIVRTHEKLLERRDSLLAANYWLSLHAEDEQDVAERKLDILVSSQHASEYHMIWMRAQLDKAISDTQQQ